MYRVTLKIFAVLVVQDIHVVLILIFKLLSFLHLYLLFYGRGYGQAAAIATIVPLFTPTSAVRMICLSILC